MNIELKTHVGIGPRGNEVPYDEDIILVDGQNVGKLGRKPEHKIAWFTKLPTAIRKEIETEVSALVGRDVANSHVPPKVGEFQEAFTGSDDDLDIDP